MPEIGTTITSSIKHSQQLLDCENVVLPQFIEQMQDESRRRVVGAIAIDSETTVCAEQAISVSEDGKAEFHFVDITSIPIESTIFDEVKNLPDEHDGRTLPLILKDRLHYNSPFVNENGGYVPSISLGLSEKNDLIIEKTLLENPETAEIEDFIDSNTETYARAAAITTGKNFDGKVKLGRVERSIKNFYSSLLYDEYALSPFKLYSNNGQHAFAHRPHRSKGDLINQQVISAHYDGRYRDMLQITEKDCSDTLVSTLEAIENPELAPERFLEVVDYWENPSEFDTAVMRFILEGSSHKTHENDTDIEELVITALQGAMRYQKLARSSRSAINSYEKALFARDFKTAFTNKARYDVRPRTLRG